MFRCSVGGADYGSVRVGAFMGLRMVSEMARDAPAWPHVPAPAAPAAAASPSRGEHYLCNMSHLLSHWKGVV